MEVTDHNVQKFGLREALCSVVRGAGQVMFQDSVWCGLIFLVAIFVGAWQRGSLMLFWGAVVALVVATFAGLWMTRSREETRDGLLGFNAILVGCAFSTFLRGGWVMWLTLVLCSLLSVMIRSGLNRMLKPYGVGSYTLPFVFSTWLFLLAAQSMDSLSVVGLGSPHLVHSESSVINLGFANLLTYWLIGISQVFLIDSWLSGAIFLVGLFVASPKVGLWAALASALSTALAIVLGCSGAAIASGLYGFSAPLTAIALSLSPRAEGFGGVMWVLCGVVVTLFVQVAMNSLVMPFGMPSLTFPFCITALIFLLSDKKA